MVFTFSSLYRTCLSSITSNVPIVDSEYLQEICSPTFIVDDFLGLFLNSYIYLIKYSRSKIINNRWCLNNRWRLIRFPALI